MHLCNALRSIPIGLPVTRLTKGKRQECDLSPTSRSVGGRRPIALRLRAHRDSALQVRGCTMVLPTAHCTTARRISDPHWRLITLDTRAVALPCRQRPVWRCCGRFLGEDRHEACCAAAARTSSLWCTRWTLRTAVRTTTRATTVPNPCRSHVTRIRREGRASVSPLTNRACLRSPNTQWAQRRRCSPHNLESGVWSNAGRPQH